MNRLGKWLGLCVGLGTMAAAAATFPDSGQSSATPPTAPRFALVPTGSASSSESGVVTLGGPAHAITDLSVKLQQMAPGLYWVVMVRQSDGAKIRLAPISVFDSSEAEPDRLASGNTKQRTSGHQVQVLDTQALIKIPEAFDAADVAEIVIEDINGTPLLRGAPARR